MALYLTVIVLILVLFAIKASAMKLCLEKGYPDVKMTYTFEAYCVKRVNQTDEVIPVR